VYKKKSTELVCSTESDFEACRGIGIGQWRTEAANKGGGMIKLAIST
jgi:hypothetical protein